MEVSQFHPETEKKGINPNNPVNLYPVECEAYSTGAVQAFSPVSPTRRFFVSFHTFPPSPLPPLAFWAKAATRQNLTFVSFGV
jgi:hypothetical protein